MNQYAERNARQLDKAGGYYIRHIQAMTKENLDRKSDIAAELGYRDMIIDQLRKQVDNDLVNSMNTNTDTPSFEW